MAVSVTDKPLTLIAELNKKYNEAVKNRGPRLWTEISSALRTVVLGGEKELQFEVAKDLGEFIENRIRNAGLTFTAKGTMWTISGWDTWVDPDAIDDNGQKA